MVLAFATALRVDIYGDSRLVGSAAESVTIAAAVWFRASLPNGS
jgi:hypothetical protein